MYKRICSAILTLSLAAILLPQSVSVALSAADLPSAEEISVLPKYDGRDYGIITPVKDQGSSNLCWAYSTIAASETAILRSRVDPNATADNLSLNPLSAAYHVFNRGSDPLGNTNGLKSNKNFHGESGNPRKIVPLLAAGWGPVINDVYYNQDPHDNVAYRLKNAFYIPQDKTDAGIKAVKESVAKYGAVTFQYNNVRETQYYNPKNEQGGTSSPHACTIIGWDDTISASKFYPGGAVRDGGWLVKNSYSSLPYFYLSYDNTSDSMYAFEYSASDSYDYNYYYDDNVDDFSLRQDRHMANVYQAQNSFSGQTEYLSAVNAGITAKSSYTLEVKVYTGLSEPQTSAYSATGGNLAAAKTMTFPLGGFVTVPLDTPVALEKGQWFSVVVRVADSDASIKASAPNGKSYSYIPYGSGWSALPYSVGRIKALTKVAASASAGQTPRSLTIKGDVTSRIPSVGTVNVPLTAMAQYVGASTNVTAETVWTIAGGYSGVKVDMGVVTIQSDAPSGDVTIQAAYKGLTKTHTISLSRDAELPSKATLNLKASPDRLTGGGAVTINLTSNPSAAAGSVTLTCSDSSVSMTRSGNTWTTGTLPDSDKTYTFTATLPASTQYQASEAKATVLVTKSAVTPATGGGGSEAAPTQTSLPAGKYAVSVKASGGGSVNLSQNEAESGTSVSVTVQPDNSYVVEAVTAVTEAGIGVILSKNGGNSYNFIMPPSDVTVTVSFKPAQERQPKTKDFEDVPQQAYYFDSVKWAVEKGITSGVGDGMFSPDNPCTRAQIVTFLWRAAGSPIVDSEDNPFVDVPMSAYYYQAVMWAVKNGITGGMGEGLFSPNDTCTRNQGVTFIYRSNGSPAAEGLSFSDVAADAYYAKAVSWAAKKGITGGTGDGLFSPNANCTRGQIVTFIYRAAE